MKILGIPGLLAAMLLSTSWPAAADRVLTVQAREAIAQLQPRDAELSQVRLPALELAILASFECPGDSKASSLTVSVSDSYQHFGTELLTDAASLEASFSVPAGQLPPIAIPEFCISGERTGDRGLQLPGIATAQASLRCSSANDTISMHFQSVSVPVRLYCLEDGDPEESSSLDK